MSETKFVFDYDMMVAHLSKVRDSVLKYAGVKNHNPFLFIANNIVPLEVRLGTKEKGERTPDLEKAILALSPTHVPVVDPNYKEATPDTSTPKMKTPGFVIPK